MTNQNNKFQISINETLAKNEVLERELNTQNEILKQYEIAKKEYVSKLKHELDTVEARFFKIINENNMVGEDYRSQAVHNLHKYVDLKMKYEENLEKMHAAIEKVKEYDVRFGKLATEGNRDLMFTEDLRHLIYKLSK